MRFRFTYVGERGEDDLDLGSRLLRELSPVVEERLSASVGEADVEHRLGDRAMAVRVKPGREQFSVDERVRAEIGDAILSSLMDVATETTSRPTLSHDGQLLMGSFDGRRFGL